MEAGSVLIGVIVIAVSILNIILKSRANKAKKEAENYSPVIREDNTGWGRFDEMFDEDDMEEDFLPPHRPQPNMVLQPVNSNNQGYNLPPVPENLPQMPAFHSDSSEKLLSDISGNYVFGETFNTRDSAQESELSESNHLISINKTNSANDKQSKIIKGFNLRDAVIYSEILKPKFNE